MSGAVKQKTTELKRSLPEALAKVLRCREGVSGAQLTTFGLGGAAAFVVEPAGITPLQELVSHFFQAGVAYRALGAGSNVVVPDAGLALPIIRLGREFSGASLLDSSSCQIADLLQLGEKPARLTEVVAQALDEETEVIRLLVLAGTSLMSLSRETCQRGFAGLEFAAGIPATLGGAVAMNAGAHASSMDQVIEAVFLLEPNGELALRSAAEMEFSYRHSTVSAGQIVLAAVLKLRRGEVAQINNERNRCLNYRKKTQPLSLPSAGSVFRNPDCSYSSLGLTASENRETVAAAELIELLGIKGLQKDGIQFSPLHANWLVKVAPDALSSGVAELISLAKDRVSEKFGVTLKPEIILW